MPSFSLPPKISAVNSRVRHQSRRIISPLCALFVACFLLTAFVRPASAGSVFLDTLAAYPNPRGGGPFEAHVVTPITGHAANTTFLTFCVEYTEDFHPGTTYDTNIANKAVFGQSGPPSGSDLLTSQTAWLYSTFLSGGLAASVPSWTGSVGDLYALQDAIWKTQGWVLSDTPGATLNLSNALVAAAPSNGGLYGVQVMQLWDVGEVGQVGFQHQDQLILVPTPMAAMAGLVLLSSLMMVRFSSNWRSRNHGLD